MVFVFEVRSVILGSSAKEAILWPLRSQEHALLLAETQSLC